MSTKVSLKHASTTNRKTNGSSTISVEEFHERLADLAAEWRSHRRNDLAIRHQTGLLLNSHFGPPNKRQARGEEVMKEASSRLGILESELSRMRRFAYHFKSLKILRKKHPKATTWTRVRKLLVRRPHGRKAKGGSDQRMKTTRLQKVYEPLATLTSAFTRLKIQPTDVERERLQVQFDKFVKAMPHWLKSRLVTRKSA